MPTINLNKRIKEKPTPYYHENVQSDKFYNSVRWHNLRNWYIKQHPFCECCESKGKVKLAEQVHHKIEFLKGITEEDRWNLLLDEDNLMSVCTECHIEIHNQRRKDKKDK